MQKQSFYNANSNDDDDAEVSKRQGFASKLIVLTVNLLNIFSVKHIAKQHLECLK